jgi:EmrB/QacA subfamily drug resistance transporter
MTQGADRLDKSTILGLVAMALAVLVVANDFTSLSVALPALERDFGVGVNKVQWVINGYALVFGVLIVTGGRLADMFGRRQMFLLGAGVFAVFSVIGGLAPNVTTLLVARALMGVGGALMWPATLGMTFAILPPSRVGLGGGLILGTAGFGNAVGPLIGGVLTDTFGWRWIFFLNLPVAAFAMLVAWRFVVADAGTIRDRRVDYAGIASLSFGLFALLLGLDEGVDLGWTDPWIVADFLVAGLSLAAFFAIERRVDSAAALVPRDVLDNRAFLAACITVLLMSALFFAALLYLPQLMTKLLRYSAAASGVGLLPLMGVFALTSFVAGPMYERVGPKIMVSLGATFLASGMFLLSQVASTTTFDGLVPGMVVLGIGVGLFYSSITTAAVTSVDPSRSSLASGIVYMFQVAGGAVGLGVNTAIAHTTPTLVEGIGRAFAVDALLATVGLAIALLFIGARVPAVKPAIAE